MSIEVSLTSQSDFHARTFKIYLECIETYWQSGGKGGNVQRTAAIAQEVETLMEGPMVSAGYNGQWQHTMNVPEGAIPTTRGKTADIRWQARASLDVPMGRDIELFKTVDVFPQASISSSGLGGSTLTEVFWEGSLLLSLSSGVMLAGEYLEGTLQVNMTRNLRNYLKT